MLHLYRPFGSWHELILSLKINFNIRLESNNACHCCYRNTHDNLQHKAISHDALRIWIKLRKNRYHKSGSTQAARIWDIFVCPSFTAFIWLPRHCQQPNFSWLTISTCLLQSQSVSRFPVHFQRIFHSETSPPRHLHYRWYLSINEWHEGHQHAWLQILLKRLPHRKACDCIPRGYVLPCGLLWAFDTSVWERLAFEES